MNNIVLGVLLVGVVSAGPTADIRHVRCDSDLTATWPNEVEDSDLFWASNEDENLSGPKFRLFSEVDVRTVEANTEYKFKLSSLDPNTKLDRFLISIEQEEISDEHSSLPKEACKEPGRLQSLSDESEHLSYKCPRYLVERSNLNGFYSEVPFEWTAPECGCVEISVEVLDTNNKIYTKEDDRFFGLKLRACVRPQLVEKVLPNPENVVENYQNVTENEAQNTELKTQHENDDGDEILRRIREWYNEDETQIETEDETEEEILPVPDALIGSETELDKEPGTKKKLKSLKTQEKKKEKKQRRRARKENRKRKGKKICCKKGVETKLSLKNSEECSQVPQATLTKAVQNFGLKSHVCSRVFKLCCEDEVLGEKKIKKLKRKTKEAKKGLNLQTEKKERRNKNGKKEGDAEEEEEETNNEMSP